MDDYKIFTEYKKKIININDLNEIKSLINSAKDMTNNDVEKLLLDSLVNEDRYQNSMNIDKFKLYLDIIDFIYYYNDAVVIIDDIELNNKDKSQIKTLKRLIQNKPIKNVNNVSDYKSIFYKNCPHCGKKNPGTLGTTYIICGYNNKGFDWKGCGHDWCFKCGKKLCKNWNNNMLFNKANRFHDGKCCKHYANLIGDIYNDTFCQCNHNMRHII